MRNEPPPVPMSDQEEESHSFARRAATACLACPLVVIAVAGGIRLLHWKTGGAVPRQLMPVVGLMALVLGIAGIVFGVLALVFAKGPRRVWVIFRAVCGMILLSALVGMAIPGFIRGFKRARAMADTSAAVKDVRAQSIAALTDPKHAQKVDLSQLEGSLSRAAAASSGDAAAILRASQSYLKHLEEHRQAYDSALRQLTAARVLSSKNLVERDQIGQRKTVVTNFLDANNAFKVFFTQGQSQYRQELADEGVSQNQTEAAVNAFEKKFTVQLPFITQIREADDHMGQAMLGVLDLLDANWGQWKYNEATGKLRFEDTEAAGKYNDFMASIRQAAAEQAAAQKGLAAAQITDTSTP